MGLFRDIFGPPGGRRTTRAKKKRKSPLKGKHLVKFWAKKKKR